MKYYEGRPKITAQNVKGKIEKKLRQSLFETDRCFTRLKAGFIYIIITFFYVHENTPHITQLGLKCVYKSNHEYTEWERCGLSNIKVDGK
jgi:hypothetical protein